MIKEVKKLLDKVLKQPLEVHEQVELVQYYILERKGRSVEINMQQFFNKHPFTVRNLQLLLHASLQAEIWYRQQMN